jgi:hypothetical protein
MAGFYPRTVEWQTPKSFDIPVVVAILVVVKIRTATISKPFDI